jgi:hypothetical protein
MDAITDEELNTYIAHMIDWESMGDFLPKLARMSKQEIADDVHEVLHIIEEEQKK